MENSYVWNARLSQKCERYEDMASWILKCNEKSGELTEEQRELLSIAFKNSVGESKRQHRVIDKIIQMDKYPLYEEELATFKSKISAEIITKCEKVIELLEKELIPKTSSVEGLVFYNKMVGDYNRFICGVSEGKRKVDCAKNALNGYETARKIGRKINKAHPYIMALKLNLAIFFDEILKDKKRAVEIAKNAYEDALVHLNEDKRFAKDSSYLFDILRELIVTWKQSPEYLNFE